MAERLPAGARTACTAGFLAILAVALLDLAAMLYLALTPSYIDFPLVVQHGRVEVIDAPVVPGLRDEDVVTAIDGQPVLPAGSVADLKRLLAGLGRRPEVDLTISRANGDSVAAVPAVLQRMPLDDAATSSPSTFWVLLVAILALMAGAAAPFVGMALAITRGGLWDVDRLARHARLVGILGALFISAWLAFEIALEILSSLPARIRPCRPDSRDAPTCP